MIVLAVLALGAPALAQTTTPKPPPTYEQVIVNTWKNLHNKILTMAKDTVYPMRSWDGSRIRIRAACSRSCATSRSVWR